MGELATAELARIGIIEQTDVLDFHVARVPKAYPAYFGTYDRFDELRTWTDSIANLFLVGRNGMHRYNNQDHFMTTAKLAVDQKTLFPATPTNRHSGRSILRPNTMKTGKAQKTNE